MRRMRIRLSLRLLLVVVCFCFILLSGIYSRADRALELGYDYRVYLKSYASTDDLFYPDTWLSDSTFIEQYRFTTDMTGSYMFTLPYMGAPAKWQFFEFRFANFNSDVFSVGDLQVLFDVKFSSVDIGYLLVYSGDVTSVDVMQQPLAVRVISLDAGNIYSVDEVIDTTDPLFNGNISIVFACQNNQGYDVSVNWTGLHIQKFDEEEDTGGLNLIRYIKNIWNGIKSLPSNIANALSGFFISLENTFTLVIDGLMSFINDLIAIPDKSYFDEFIDELNFEMRDHLGSIYQVIDFIADIFDMLLSPTIRPSITFPEIKFQDYVIIESHEVNIIPDGFDYLLDYVRTATSIVLVLSLFNYLRKQPYIIIGMIVDITTANKEVTK